MRHPVLQRIVSLCLLVGTAASLLPFGHEALAQEQWNLWATVLHRFAGTSLTADPADGALGAAAKAAENASGFARRDDPRPAFVPATMPATPSASAMPLVAVVAESRYVPTSRALPGTMPSRVPSPGHAALGMAIAPRAP